MLGIFQTLFSPPRDLIFILVAAWLGMALAERRAPRHGIPVDAVSSLVFYGLLALILGGRIIYAASHLSAFIQSPGSLISLNYALFDTLGGAVCALLVAWIYGQRRRLPLWSSLDALTPFFGMLAVGLGLAHLASGTAYGKPSTVPWAIQLWGASRHPSQLYESLAALSILVFAWFQRAVTRPGLTFLSFIALTAGARLFLEAYRGDSVLLAGGLRLAQLIAWLILAGSLLLFERRLHGPLQAPSPDPKRQ